MMKSREGRGGRRRGRRKKIRITPRPPIRLTTYVSMCDLFPLQSKLQFVLAATCIQIQMY